MNKVILIIISSFLHFTLISKPFSMFSGIVYLKNIYKGQIIYGPCPRVVFKTRFTYFYAKYLVTYPVFVVQEKYKVQKIELIPSRSSLNEFKNYFWESYLYFVKPQLVNIPLKIASIQSSRCKSRLLNHHFECKFQSTTFWLLRDGLHFL